MIKQEDESTNLSKDRRIQPIKIHSSIKILAILLKGLKSHCR